MDFGAPLEGPGIANLQCANGNVTGGIACMSERKSGLSLGKHPLLVTRVFICIN